MSSEETKFLTVPEAAELLRIDRGRFYGLVRSGAIPAVHVGHTVRISVTALQEWATAGGTRKAS
jgi:excisionase family DNA binding protein